MKRPISPLAAALVAGVSAAALVFSPCNAQHVDPPEIPLEGASWRFVNPNQHGNLGRSTFNAAFEENHPFWDWLGSEIVYHAFKEQFNALCFGMSLLAAKTAETGSHAAPFAGTLREPIWRRHASTTEPLLRSLRTYHWKQLSRGYVRAFADGRRLSPRQTMQRVKDDVDNGRLGVISITTNTRIRNECAWLHPSGHTMIPVSVTESSTPGSGMITVYDPNHPYTRENAGLRALNESAHPPIVINGDRWSFGSWGQQCGHLSYVRLPSEGSWDSDWKKSAGLSEGFIYLFSAGTEVEQITDGSGRTLYAANGADGALAGDIVRFAALSQAKDKMKATKPDQAKKIQTMKPAARPEAAISAGLQRTLAARYEPKFGKGSDAYIVLNPRLTDLEVTFKASAPGKTAHMLVANGRESYELTFTPPSKGARVHSAVKVSRANDLKSGLTFRALAPAGVTAKLDHITATRTKTINLESVAPFRVAAEPVAARIDASRGLALSGPPAAINARRTMQKIDAQGRVVKP